MSFDEGEGLVEVDAEADSDAELEYEFFSCANEYFDTFFRPITPNFDNVERSEKDSDVEIEASDQSNSHNNDNCEWCKALAASNETNRILKRLLHILLSIIDKYGVGLKDEYVRKKVDQIKSML